MTPAVSIVLPTYNRADLLAEAIASVRAQTFRDWELIVVDDGSTDRTPEALRAWAAQDPRLRWVTGAHRGVSAARNVGLRAATGGYLAFQDDDDVWRPAKLARQVAALEAHPAWAFVYTQAELRYEDGTSKLREPLADSFETLLARNTIALPAVLLRRAIAVSLGGFREEMDVAEDVDLWLRLAARHPFGVLPEALTVCRQSQERNDARYRRAIHNHLRTLTELRAIVTPARRRLVRKKMAKEHYKLARLNREAGQPLAACRAFLRAIGLDGAVGLAWRKDAPSSSLGYLAKPYLGVCVCAAQALAGALVRPKTVETKRSHHHSAH